LSNRKNITEYINIKVMEYSRSKMLFLAVSAEGGIFLIALFLAQWMNIKLYTFSENTGRDILIGTAGSIIPLVLAFASLSEKAARIPFIQSLRKTVLSAIKVLFAHARLPDIILISLLAGIGEECLFRGIIQARFGIVIASILFGLVHFISPAYVILAVFMGFYLGVFFQIYGSLLISIQIHFVYDLGILLYLKYVILKREQTAYANEHPE
jgi:membrane protease YdiL (CAAX protease family)